MSVHRKAFPVALACATLASSPAWAEDPASPAAPEAPAAAAPSVASSPTSFGKIPALVTGGLAVVALGTGVVFGALAWQDHESFQSNPTTDLANRGESRGLTADMCFGGAATLAVASIVMYLTHEDATPGAIPAAQATPRVSVSVAPFFSPGGGGAGAFVRF